MQDLIEGFPYPHVFDKPEQIFVPRTGLRANTISLFIFRPYIPRSEAEALHNCHFREYSIEQPNLNSLYTLSRMYSHLFCPRNQSDLPLQFRKIDNAAIVEKYIDWLLAEENRYKLDNIYRMYNAIHSMQHHVKCLNERFKNNYKIPDNMIPPEYSVKTNRKYKSSFDWDVCDPFATAIASLRYHFDLHNCEYQILSDDRFNRNYLYAKRSYSLASRIYISNIDGNWYYDSKRTDLINNIPGHPIDEFPDGTVFVTAFDRRELLNVLDAKDYASNKRSCNALLKAMKSCKGIFKDKSILDNTIGKYLDGLNNWYVRNIYLKKVDGRLEFAYY